jgi:predicted hotdog family 3-hydroxylacyl-ACP dehydratase
VQHFNNILEYIPHRPPFVMVDELISVSENITVSGFKITEDNIFSSEGYFYEGGLIENIAQTIAAGAKYRIGEIEEYPSIGMIGAVKRLKINNRPRIGDILKTEVTLITEFENALIIEGSVFCNNFLVAQCQMNIFIIKNPKEIPL